MGESETKPAPNTWLLRYIVTAETAAIIMLLTFYFSGFHNLVTHDELDLIAFPYIPDREIVRTHILESEKSISGMTSAIHKLNLVIEKSNHAMDLRISLLEDRAKRERAVFNQ